MRFRNSAPTLLASAGLLVSLSVFSAPAHAQADISDSTSGFTVGIDPSGALYNGNSFHGFVRNSDGYDPLAPGTPRDSWGISVGGVGGYADPSFFGTTVTNNSFTSTANSAFSSNSFGGVTVNQTYSFLAPNVIKIGTTLTNLSGSAQAILFQRDVDWDFPQVNFNNYTTVDPLSGNVTDASYEGFENPDPTVPYGSTFGAPGGTSGDADYGGGIKLDLGTLADGASTSFNFYYGISAIGQTPNSLRSQTAGLGASFLVTSYSDDGDINTASQASIIGYSPAAVPEPSTYALLASLGVTGAGFLARRRKAAK